MILLRYVDLRHHFAAPPVEVTQSITFISGTPDRLSLGSGSWTALGIFAGMTLTVSGSSSNDFGLLEVAETFGRPLDLTVSGVLTNEGPVSVDISAEWIAPDGHPEWPGPQSRGSNLVRANGFSDDLWSVSLSGPYAGSSFTVSINGGAADASPGVDEYDWYLSQRTDDPTKQFLAMTQTPNAGGNSYSGSVDIVHTDLAEDEMATLVAKNVSVAEHTRLFKNCYLYVRRRSDGAIQWLDLQRATGV